MSKRIKVKLSISSIQHAIDEVKKFQKTVSEMGDRMAKVLALRGYDVAFSIIAGHVHTGETRDHLRVEKVADGKYILRTDSQAILFFEFGAGITKGGGHPWDDITRMGPSSYPGEGHWDDPNGWWFPTEDPSLVIFRDNDGKGWGHSIGQPPHMPFFLADQKIKKDVLEVAKGVLNGRY